MMAGDLNLTDTHCHLILAEFDDDREMVIGRAEQQGVQKMLVPGIDLQTSRQAVELAGQYESIHAAVGIHPHMAADWNESVEKELLQLVQADKVVAIGEIGLDYYRDFSPRRVQMEAFEAQLALAHKTDLPVIVHQRESLEDVLDRATKWSGSLDPARPRPPGVLHAFSGLLDQGIEAIRAGFFLGVAGPVTFKNAQVRRDITINLPMESLLLETDSPYLSPHPYRGKRNEPHQAQIIAEKLADMLNMRLADVANATHKNATVCFGW